MAQQIAAPIIERDVRLIAPPPFYRVLMLNDDYTPMDFVVDVLQKFFHKDHESAMQIMLKIHTHGHATCGIYSKDIAMTKAESVCALARKEGHPLRCTVESL